MINKPKESGEIASKVERRGLVMASIKVEFVNQSIVNDFNSNVLQEAL